jgi:hypothetical protein
MIRLALKIEREKDALVTFALYVNGVRASGQCGITVRTAELVDVIRHINPDGVRVDREMVSAYLVSLLQPLENERQYIRYV